MPSRRIVVALLLAALSAPAHGALAATGPATDPVTASPTSPVATADEPDDQLIVFTDYTDHAVIERFETATGRLLSRVVESGHDPDDLPARQAGRGAAHPAHGDAHDEAGGGGESSSSDPKCTNSSTWNYLTWGNPSARVARRWPMPPPVSYNPTGQPTVAGSSNPKSLFQAAADQWANTTNPCGLPDTIAWEPAWGADNSSPGACTVDKVNNIGWSNLGGWDPGLVLGRVCARVEDNVGLGIIVETDMTLNNNAAAVWCNGACADGFDVQSVVAHEFGHFLGLGHVCNDSDLNNPCNTTAESSAVMYPWIDFNDTRNRTLSAGDIAGALDLYPQAYAFQVVNLQVVNPGPNSQLVPGSTYTARVDLKNVGFQPWIKGSAGDVKLDTDPSGRTSAFQGPDWISPTRASHLDQQVAGWGPWAEFPLNTSSLVVYGETGRFEFQVTIPADQEGPATEAFRPVVTSGTPFGPGTVDLSLDVGTYGSSAVVSVRNDLPGQKLAPGREYVVDVDVTNTGSLGWASPTDVHLDTHPLGRTSDFQAPDWVSATRASEVDSDLAPGTPRVEPGETVRFTFRMALPADRESAEFEQFAPVLDLSGGPRRLSPTTVNLDIGAYDTEVADHDGPDLPLALGLKVDDLIIRTRQSDVVLDFTNSGTAPWLVGDDLVHLTTTGPCHWIGDDWTTCDFISVIDENLTDAAKPYVAPGEVARFRFHMSLPATAGPIGQGFGLNHDATFSMKIDGGRMLPQSPLLGPFQVF